MAPIHTDVVFEALLESAPREHVGDRLDSVEVEPGVVTHAFECTSPGYPGWYWAVTAVTIEDVTTVSEVNLLPGATAIVPPAWRPWSERIEPGDLGAGDLLAPPLGDDRLTAGFTDVPEDLAVEFAGTQWELGLGREQVLSVAGLDRAVDRWLAGQTGPKSAMAKAAPGQCSTCGFLVAVGGALGQAFGICGNEYGAADGTLVAMSFGCGAHSSVRVDHLPPVPVVDLVIDDDADEVEDASGLPDYVARVPGDSDGDIDGDAESAESGDDSESRLDDAPDATAVLAYSSDEADDSVDSGDAGDGDVDEDDDDEDDDRDDDPDAVVHGAEYLEHIDADSLDWNPRADF